MVKKEKSNVTLEELEGKSCRVLVKFFVTNQKNNPMLMNNPAEHMMEGGKQTSGKKTYDPKVEAEKSAYRLPDGQLYLKAVAFQQSIVGEGGGAKNRKFGRTSATTLIKQGVSFTPDTDWLCWHPEIAFLPVCPLFDPETNKPVKKYKIDARPGVVGKARVMKWRPIFWKWGCYVVISIDTRFIQVEAFLEIFQNAGIVAGVGDYRPQCKKPGSFGRYDVSIAEMKIIEEFE